MASIDPKETYRRILQVALQAETMSPWQLGRELRALADDLDPMLPPEEREPWTPGAPVRTSEDFVAAWKNGATVG